MTNFICVTCGVQFAESEAPPAHCPVCEDERQWVRCGGHFEGAQVLHWKRQGGEMLLSGDVLQVTQTRRWLSFMYSYPNQIPLNARKIRAIRAALSGLAFDDIYGAWWDTNVIGGARSVFEKSIARYLAAIAD